MCLLISFLFTEGGQLFLSFQCLWGHPQVCFPRGMRLCRSVDIWPVSLRIRVATQRSAGPSPASLTLQPTCDLCHRSRLIALPDTLRTPSVSSWGHRVLSRGTTLSGWGGDRAPGQLAGRLTLQGHSGCQHSGCDPEPAQPQQEGFRTTDLDQ